MNHTFDARLATKLNAALSRAEASTGRTLGRVVRTSVAQGGTTSFWAALMAEALHGRSPHILLWEYAINDHAVSLEAASRAGTHSREEAKNFGAETMRYLVDYWLRRSLSLGASSPALVMAYLWDKQPAAAFKAGNRALCKRMPVPCSAFDAQLPVLHQYARAGAGLAALNMARYVTARRHGEFCPLVADSYYHPSNDGHELVADLLSEMLLKLISQLSATVAAGETSKRNVGGGGKGGGKGGASEATATLPPPRPLPRLLPAASATSAAPADGVSSKLEALLGDHTVAPHVLLAWEPQWKAVAVPEAGGPASIGGWQAAGRPHFGGVGGPVPPRRLFAKSVSERADRKWMWIVPPCKRDNSSALTVSLPRSVPTHDGGGERPLRAVSYFGMVSPGARLRHTMDGQPVTFDATRGSFLAQSWGYLQMWHTFDDQPESATVGSDGVQHGGGRGGRWRAGRAGNAKELEWRLCSEHVPGARCIGFRCGLEFKMPMKTASVGWFLTLSG